MLPFWDDNQESFWGLLWLGGDQWPGSWRLDASQKREIDVAKPSGAPPTLTDKGAGPGRAKATGMIWTPEQVDEINILLEKYSPKNPNALRTPLDIFHPSAILIGLYSVVIEEVRVTHPTDQILRIDLDLLQWFPMTKVQQATKTAVSDPLNPEDFRVDLPDAGQNL